MLADMAVIFNTCDAVVVVFIVVVAFIAVFVVVIVAGVFIVVTVFIDVVAVAVFIDVVAVAVVIVVAAVAVVIDVVAVLNCCRDKKVWKYLIKLLFFETSFSNHVRHSEPKSHLSICKQSEGVGLSNSSDQT